MNKILSMLFISLITTCARAVPEHNAIKTERSTPPDMNSGIKAIQNKKLSSSEEPDLELRDLLTSLDAMLIFDQENGLNEQELPDYSSQDIQEIQNIDKYKTTTEPILKALIDETKSEFDVDKKNWNRIAPKKKSQLDRIRKIIQEKLNQFSNTPSKKNQLRDKKYLKRQENRPDDSETQMEPEA